MCVGKEAHVDGLDRLVVLNKDENSVSFIGTEGGETLRVVLVGAHPHEVAITRDGSTAYVSNALGNSVSILDTGAMEETGRIEHEEFQFPHDLKISPDESKLYIAVTYAHKVFICERPSHRLLKIVPTGQRLSHMLAPTPDWRRLYVPNLGSNTLSVLNTETDEIEKHIVVGRKPEGVAVHPSGAFLYVANQDEDNVFALSAEHHGIVARHPVGKTPVRLVFSPDGRYAFTANRESHDVSVIDTERHWEIKRIPVGRWPGGIVFDPTGTRAYVANNKTNDVSVIDVQSLREIERFDAGVHPDGIGYLSAA
ncbi:MAG: YncE family protein [Candidatus Bipolaricaulota bacterium]|nr:MAG: YncE family protein [Candidatus Bipolaricaulota bacterium]